MESCDPKYHFYTSNSEWLCCSSHRNRDRDIPYGYSISTRCYSDKYKGVKARLLDHQLVVDAIFPSRNNNCLYMLAVFTRLPLGSGNVNGGGGTTSSQRSENDF